MGDGAPMPPRIWAPLRSIWGLPFTSLPFRPMRGERRGEKVRGGAGAAGRGGRHGHGSSCLLLGRRGRHRAS
jgi:hypothetical protein